MRITSGEELTEKQRARAEKNRLSAHESRQRKQAYILSLEQEVGRLRGQVAKLEQTVEILREGLRPFSTQTQSQSQMQADADAATLSMTPPGIPEGPLNPYQGWHSSPSQPFSSTPFVHTVKQEITREEAWDIFANLYVD